jgi:hypothetical protein
MHSISQSRDCEISIKDTSLCEMAAAAIPVFTAAGPVGWGLAAGVATVAGIIMIANAVKESGGGSTGGAAAAGGGGGADAGGGRSRSPTPPAKRDFSNTRKEAFEKAKRAGHMLKPRGPEDHGFGPHFHPRLKNFHKHDHYLFPKRFY